MAAGVTVAVAQRAQNFSRLGLEFFFFSRNVGDHVIHRVKRRHTWVTRAGKSLHRYNAGGLDAESIVNGLEREHQASGRTIWICREEAGSEATRFALHIHEFAMIGIYFGDEQRNVGLHAVIAAIADDRVTGARELFFGWTSDGGIERRETKIAIEAGAQGLYRKAPLLPEVSDAVDAPAHDIGVAFPGRAFRCGESRHAKPRMVVKTLNICWPTVPVAPRYSYAKLLHRTQLRASGPMRVPVCSGRNVLRTRKAIPFCCNGSMVRG